MKAVRRWWLLFGSGAVVLTAVLAWVSVVVLDLERAEHAARDHGAHQERVRLGLWRMDSWLAPQLAREAARPYFEYASYYPQERAYTRMLQPLDAQEILTASPLLTFASDVFPLHFQVDAEGAFTSPQRPFGRQLDLALQTCVSADVPESQGDRLALLFHQVTYEELLASTARSEGRLSRLDEAAPVVEASEARDRWADGGAYQTLLPPANPEPQQDAQTWLNKKELGKRAQAAQSAASNIAPGSFENSLPFPPQTRGDLEDLAPPAVAASVEVGPLVPVWYDDGQRLLYARRVGVDDEVLVQGVTVDWPVLRDTLLGEVADLLPEATLTPALEPSDDDDAVLATTPAVCGTPEPPIAGPSGMTPARWTLALGWVAVVLAIGAAGHTVRSSLELGERRSRFASAVTHELRTPLTTFRMYSEMLADGMITDDTTRTEYLGTLRDESERLSRLVENVLEYARLEEGRTESRAAATSVGELLDGLAPALRRRSEEADQTLELDAGSAAGQVLSCDATIVGQVLFNLVDNAAKYAADAQDRRVHVRAETASAALHLLVSDHGPGVSDAARATVFEAFERNAPDAVPGVGLGLALSRGLARRLGGDLLLDDSDEGARFRLVLPLTPPS
jgi:signal transduction histidine kinase